MWMYVLIAALVMLAVVLLMQKKREKFLGMKLPSDWTDKINKIRDMLPSDLNETITKIRDTLPKDIKLPSDLNEKMAKIKNTKDIKFPFNLTEKITKMRDTNPTGTAPSMTFEGDKYVPGYFKIQTEFPMLTKRKLRTFDIHA